MEFEFLLFLSVVLSELKIIVSLVLLFVFESGFEQLSVVEHDVSELVHDSLAKGWTRDLELAICYLFD